MALKLAFFQLNIEKTKIMASGPITSWQIDGETMQTVRDLILGGSKITTADDCSHEIKRSLFLGRKDMTNLDRRPRFDSWVGKIRWRRNNLATSVFLGLPYGSANKESARDAGELSSVPGLGRSPREGKGCPL